MEQDYLHPQYNLRSAHVIARLFELPEGNLYEIQQKATEVRTEILAVLMGINCTSPNEVEKEHFRRTTAAAPLKASLATNGLNPDELFKRAMDANRIIYNIGADFDDEEVNSIVQERIVRAYTQVLGLDENLSILEIAELIEEIGIQLSDLQTLIEY